MATPTSQSEWAAQQVASSSSVEQARAIHRVRLKQPRRSGSPLAALSHASLLALAAGVPTGQQLDARRAVGFYQALSIKTTGNASLAPRWYEQDRSRVASWSFASDPRPAPTALWAGTYARGEASSHARRYQRFVRATRADLGL